MEKLLNEMLEELLSELADDMKGNNDEVILSSKIKGAYREVKLKRNYQPHHTDEFIGTDMENMYSIIKELALYDWNLVGGEGQVSHSENGISRTWHSRGDILIKITPFATIL